MNMHQLNPAGKHALRSERILSSSQLGIGKNCPVVADTKPGPNSSDWFRPYKWLAAGCGTKVCGQVWDKVSDGRAGLAASASIQGGDLHRAFSATGPNEAWFTHVIPLLLLAIMRVRLPGYPALIILIRNQERENVERACKILLFFFSPSSWFRCLRLCAAFVWM